MSQLNSELTIKSESQIHRKKNRSLDSANHPLEGKKWWVQAEDPWQCLASCIEIRNALNHPDGPEHYGTVYVFTEQF